MSHRDTQIPFIPFDPRKRGPVDVARDAYNRVRAFVDDNSTVLIVAAVAVLALGWHFGVEIPSAPNWLIVALLTAMLASPTAWVVGTRLARALHTKNSVLLSEQNAATGDQRLIEIAPDRFEELRVVTHNGKEREDRSYLHEVWINGRRAYEVDEYHPEANVAVSSWQAGVSNSEMRREKARINQIKTDLEREADKALELLANSSSIIRKQVRQVANRVIMVAEDVEVPGGGELHENLAKELEEEDPAEALLADRTRTENGDRGDDEDASTEERVEDLIAGTVEPDPSGDMYQRAAFEADEGDLAADGGVEREQ